MDWLVPEFIHGLESAIFFGSIGFFLGVIGTIGAQRIVQIGKESEREKGRE
jgi:hypothetical protein